MLILIGLAGYLALGGVAWFFFHRMTKAKEDLFAARRQLVHLQKNNDAAKKAAQVAEARCRQAMHVAAHIKVVSQQLNGLIGYITGPLEAGQQATGRHAMPHAASRPAIAN